MSVSDFDNSLLLGSKSTNHDSSGFTQKEIIYIPDQMNGNYSSYQSIIDTQVLASSQKWASLADSYLMIPYGIWVKTDLTGGAPSIALSAFTAALKNGSHQVISSVSVDYGSWTIHQNTPNINQFISFKMMSEWTQADVDLYGGLVNFAPDNALSTVYNVAASQNGVGFANNDLYSMPYTIPSGFNGRWSGGNHGLLKRSQDMSGMALNASTGTAYMSTGNATASARNQVQISAAGASPTIWYPLMLRIRLRDLCDFFAKAPLIRGSQLRITLYFNACNFVTTITGTQGDPGTAPLMELTSYNQLAGWSNPVMLGSGRNTAAANVAGSATASATGGYTVGGLGVLTNGGADNQPNGGTITVYAGPGQSAVPAGDLALQTVGFPFNNVRLYVPQYTLKPTHELELLQSNPFFDIKYEEVQFSNIVNIANNQQVVQTVNNGLSYAKYIVLIPYLQGNFVNGSTSATAAQNEAQSPFDSCPGTTAPNASLINISIQYGAANVFQQPEVYDFSNFIDEYSQIYTRSLDAGLSNGLLDMTQWENGYRFYVCNLMRKYGADDSVPRSLIVSFQNNMTMASGVTMNVNCFIVYERKCTIENDTGLVKSVI